jgi:hypothetical protein
VKLVISKLASLFHGKDVKPAEKQEHLPSKEEILSLYQRFRLDGYGNLLLKPEELDAASLLESLGLIRITVEHYVDSSTGLTARKYATWVAGWGCQSCVHAETCPTNLGTWVHDVSFGKRCAKFVHKKLAEVLGHA